MNRKAMLQSEFLSPENQMDMRRRLFSVVCKLKIGLVQAAEDIDISQTTLHKFVTKEEDLALAPLMKIEDYILRHED